MRILHFVIATAAVTWPVNLVAQDAAGSGTGGLLGATAEKGVVAAPVEAQTQPSRPMTAGTDPKTAEPGEIVPPEPETAETPAAAASPAAEGRPVAETGDAAQGAKTATAAALAPTDTEFDAAALTPEPEAAAPAPQPRPEVELGADPAQTPVEMASGADGVVASVELGTGTEPDKDAPGEEFVRLSKEDTAPLPRPVSPELLEALAGTVLSLPPTVEFVASDIGADEPSVLPRPGETEEAREVDLYAFARMSGGDGAILEAALARLMMPDLAHADATEEVVSGAEQAVLAALADNPTAPFEEKSMTDPNEIACLEILGPPDAGVPANEAVKAAARARLVEALPACEAAAENPRAAPELLYYAAEIALARRDYAGAFALYQRAAEGGVAAAATKLADFYVFGAPPVQRDNVKAAELYGVAAEMGEPQAMTALAMMHREGTGVPQSAARMVELLTRAAEAGYHFAQFRLAQTYLDGEGIPGRSDPALGIPDPERAVMWFTRAADAGNIEAALELASLYGDPASGIPENPAEQARLTRLAADAGLPSAIAALGVLYETGRGVERSPQRAAQLYIQALETGKVSFDELRKGAPFDWDYDTAVAFQEALTERGVYDSIIDGIVGAGTRAAAEALVGG